MSFKSEREKGRPWVNADGSTNVDGFLRAYEENDNVFWLSDSGHHMNVIDELIYRLEQAGVANWRR